MSLEADYVIDRRRLKRRLLFWRIAVVAILAAVAIYALTDVKTITEGDHIARLHINNIIVEDSDREQTLMEIKDDPDVLALIVRIDSPGGTVVGGENLYYQLKAISDEKPVVAVMGSLATSAGYMIALGTDRLFARQGSLTGSIGVLLQTTDMTGLLDKIGIKPETIKSGPLKAQPNPMETLSPKAREAVKDVVMDMYEMFVDLVAIRRNMLPDEVKSLADGRIFTGRQALANGLIDAIGGETEALAWLYKTTEIPDDTDVLDVVIERPGEEWRQFVNGMVGKALFSERLRLDGLVSLWHPESW